jgi:hypothetical protein
MKIKVLIIIVLLFCYPLISQEFYKGFRVVTWEELEGLDYIILSEDDDATIIIINGETVCILNQ